MGHYLDASTLRPKKSIFKLSSLGKRNKSRRDLSESASTSECDESGKDEGDDGISRPWNFQHHIHVDEGYIGLPPSWSAALSTAGFSEEEISAIHARRQAASAANIKSGTLGVPNPHTQYSTARPNSPVLQNPAPRSSSLGILRTNQLSTGSRATGTSTSNASPAPSPRTTSFGIRSLIGVGLRGSRAPDGLSITSSRSRSGSVNGAVGETTEQYVIVEGDEPGVDQNGDGMGDETLIEPFPFDVASVMTHQSHPGQNAQEQLQQTPRGPQSTDTGHIPFPSASTPSRGVSPLVNSSSLPVPTPRSGANSISNRSADSSVHHASPSPSPSHSVPGQRPATDSSTLRTPPRRIYHVANGSSDSYCDPPPAYASPIRGETFRREKEGLHETPVSAGPSSSPKTRPVPPATITKPADESSQISQSSGSGSSASGSSSDRLYDIDPFDASDIPATVEDVLDISAVHSSLYVDSREDVDDTQRLRLLAITPPLVIDKRLTRLTGFSAQAPRISFHQEGSLEDWSSALFSAIDSGSDTAGGRSGSGPKPFEQAMKDEKAERRTTLRPMSLLAQKAALLAVSPAPKLADVSFGRNISLGAHVRQGPVQASDEVEQEVESDVEEEEDTASVHGNIKQLDEPQLELSTTPPSPTVGEPSPIPNVAPPVPKEKPAPLLCSLVPPKSSATGGADGKPPVSPFVQNKPLPLPLPIPPDQIRAQLRPSKLDDVRSASAQPQTAESQSQARLQPSAGTSESEPSGAQSSSSSSTLVPKSNPGDRDSGMSTVTVTPATIVVVKREAVRRAAASIIDSDTMSLTSLSMRDSVASAFGVSRNSRDDECYGNVDYERQDEEYDEAAEDESQDYDTDPQSLSVSGHSRQPSSPSPTWPAPPPPPVELDKDATPRPVSRFRTSSLQRVSQLPGFIGGGMLGSPRTGHFPHASLETASTCESAPLTTPKGLSPSPLVGKGLAPEAKLLVSRTGTFGGVDVESEDEAEPLYARSVSSSKASTTPSLRSVASSLSQFRSPAAPLPPLPVEGQDPSSLRSDALHPLLAPLHSFISPHDPSALFTELVEIAEGESGSVYAARTPAKLPSTEKSSALERPIPAGTSHVAIKRILLPPLFPSASPNGTESPAGTDESLLHIKISSLLHELTLLRSVEYEHLLLLDGAYVHTSVNTDESPEESASKAMTLDTSLWIRMELMERSLADVIALVAQGLALQERMVARFTSDVLLGLEYLQKQHIAHRDVRSDNLLLNAAGVVKLADFSNAIRAPENASIVTGAVGVIYWQAPEMRGGPYDALKVDVWSVGATVWELAETVPPFSMPASPDSQTVFSAPTSKQFGLQWPPLSHPEHYSRGFHEFLRLCGVEAVTRPSPTELLNSQFIRNACGRAVIRQLLSQCRAMEEAMFARENA